MLLEWWTDQIKSPKTVRVKPTQDTMKGRCIFSGGSHMTIRSVYRRKKYKSVFLSGKKGGRGGGGFFLLSLLLFLSSTKKLTNNIINHKPHKILQLHRSLSQRMCPICPAKRHGSNHGRNGLSSPPGFNSIPDETGHETDKHGEVSSSHSPAHS